MFGLLIGVFGDLLRSQTSRECESACRVTPYRRPTVTPIILCNRAWLLRNPHIEWGQDCAPKGVNVGSRFTNSANSLQFPDRISRLRDDEDRFREEIRGAAGRHDPNADRFPCIFPGYQGTLAPDGRDNPARDSPHRHDLSPGFSSSCAPSERDKVRTTFRDSTCCDRAEVVSRDAYGAAQRDLHPRKSLVSIFSTPTSRCSTRRASLNRGSSRTK